MRPYPVRWGILGPGAIANAFADGLKAVPGAELLACASRDPDRAKAFADRHGIPRRHAGYDALAADPDVDAVYVATPHPFHAAHAMMCLDAGKAVLGEKPFALNAREAEAMAACARKRGVFLMEAMWTRFLPHITEARRLLAEGRIGCPMLWRADFAFRAGPDPEGRLLNPRLGGGGLLDVGVYTVSLASFFLGPIAHIAAQAKLGPTGVDMAASLCTRHEGGALGSLACGVGVSMPQTAALFGENGRIEFPEPWWRPSALVVHANGSSEEIRPPLAGNGYNCQAEEVHRCLREGLRESPVMPLDESIAVLRALDDARRQIGLAYPGE